MKLKESNINMDLVVDSESAAYAATLSVQNRRSTSYINPVEISKNSTKKEMPFPDSDSNAFPALAGPHYVDSDGTREWCTRHNHYYDTSVDSKGKSEYSSDLNAFAMDFVAGTVAGIASTGTYYKVYFTVR